MHSWPVQSALLTLHHMQETPLRRRSSEGCMPESLQGLKEEQAQLVQRIQQQLQHFVQDAMPDKCLVDDDI